LFYGFSMNFVSPDAPAALRRGLPWSTLLLAGLWTWAIWSCAEHWEGNPNYSYGWAVPLLAAGFALRRLLFLPNGGEAGRIWVFAGRLSVWTQIWLAVVSCLAVFLLEYSRDQMWHPEIVLWLICLLAVVGTLAVFWLHGGGRVVRAEVFPILFFLSAVPWPPRFEQPIVSGLMRWVAGATTELLHWFGIEAQTSGAAIALHSGLVGISEACSGVRSLQAGIMFGLAMGEWFLLKPARRVLLLFIAVALALASNLGRTLALSLQAEWHGIDSLGRVHDLIGNIAITTLIVAIWLIGKLLALRSVAGSTLSPGRIWETLRRFTRRIMVPDAPLFRALAMGLAVGIVCARGGYAWGERLDHTRTTPLFAARIDSANKFLRLPPEIWNELRPTTAQYIRRQSSELPGGTADCFHFFWKPSAWNRFALVHRPDICMPGIGWKETEAPEPSNINLNGRPVRCHFFRFRRGDTYAVELWGVWRNGEPVPLDYNATQALGAAAPPPSLHLEGKARSATEIIACSVIAKGNPPSDKIAVALLQSVFEYTSQ
jgi:exosortase